MSGRGLSLRRRPKVTVRVLSPFPDQSVRPRPTLLERLRGLVGATALVLIVGAVMAVAIAALVLTLAILIATAFN